MLKWTMTIALAITFFFVPTSATYIVALVWGFAMARQSVNRNLFLALMIAGLLLMYFFVPPRMQLLVFRIAMVGFLLGGLLIGIRFARQFFAADMNKYLKEQARDHAQFNKLLRDSLAIARSVLPGETGEIFFSRSDDRFASSVAQRYQGVGWGATVYHIPVTGAIGGDNVVVITAPSDPQEFQTSLVVFDFWMD